MLLKRLFSALSLAIILLFAITPSKTLAQLMECTVASDYEHLFYVSDQKAIGIKNKEATLLSDKLKPLYSLGFSGQYKGQQLLSSTSFALQTTEASFIIQVEENKLTLKKKQLIPFSTEGLDAFFYLNDDGVAISVEVREQNAHVEVISADKKLLNANYGFGKKEGRNTYGGPLSAVYIKSQQLLYFTLPQSEKFLIVNTNPQSPKITMKFIDFQAASKTEEAFWLNDPVSQSTYFITKTKGSASYRLFDITEENKLIINKKASSGRSTNSNWNAYLKTELAYLPIGIINNNLLISKKSSDTNNCYYTKPLGE